MLALLLLPLSVTVVAVLPDFAPTLLVLVVDDEELYDAPPLLMPEEVEDVDEDEECVVLSTTIATG